MDGEHNLKAASYRVLVLKPEVFADKVRDVSQDSLLQV